VAIAPNGNLIITGWNAKKLDGPSRGPADLRAPLVTLVGGERAPQ